eukprot:6476143-Amphidinium_carterae.1
MVVAFKTNSKSKQQAQWSGTDMVQQTVTKVGTAEILKSGTAIMLVSAKGAELLLSPSRKRPSSHPGDAPAKRLQKPHLLNLFGALRERTTLPAVIWMRLDCL